MPQTTILILAANPKGTPTLRLDQEVRDIGEGLRRASHRDTFKLESRWAVRPRDLQRALLDLNPQIFHFCGHGQGQPIADSDEPSRKLNAVTATSVIPEGLALEDSNGNLSLVSTEALANLFALFKGSIQSVVLNACYSANQADAIAQHIPYVIGMNKAIGDKAAIAFAVSFYDAIGAGKDIPFAFELAKNTIQLAGIPEHLTPVLRANPNITPAIEPQPMSQSPTKSTSKLTSGQRTRLEQKMQTLREEHQLRSEKLTTLRQNAAIEAGTAIKFQLEKQIEVETAKVAELEQELDRIEQQLME
jgi:hypothetical protein